MKPVKNAALLLRDVFEGDYSKVSKISFYKEQAPEIGDLREAIADVADKLEHVSAERDRIAYTIDNMSEGMVVLDNSMNIILTNKSAEAFFGVSNIKGQNLLHMTHMPRVVEAAQQAVKNDERASFDIQRMKDDRVLQILISPVHADDHNPISGAIMLITDMTVARHAEEIRSEFVANVSHELKTPLTSIKGFAELMDSGIIDDEESVSKYLKLICDETDRMIILINDILKLSELDSFASDTGKSMLSLRVIAQKVAESLQLQAAAKEVTIKVTGDMGSLNANPDRMTELILNLTDNAVKYNKLGGSVEVNIQQLRDSVAITVSDTGMGIPKESQERVFERFYRVDKGRSRRMGGTGLGLAIVKHIVGLYKGTIRLESKLNEGTAITVELPVK